MQRLGEISQIIKRAFLGIQQKQKKRKRVCKSVTERKGEMHNIKKAKYFKLCFTFVFSQKRSKALGSHWVEYIRGK